MIVLNYWHVFFCSPGFIALDVVMQQHNLHEFCLDLLGNFAETIKEQKFILSKGVFPHVIDAVLLQPGSQTERASSLAVISVNEAAIGCCLGWVYKCTSCPQSTQVKVPISWDIYTWGQFNKEITLVIFTCDLYFALVI